MNIRFKMLGNTTVKLLWEPPPKNHRNGPLLGYKVIINMTLQLDFFASG